MSLFELTAVLFTLTAAFAWLNHQFIRMPNSIGLLVMGLVSSLLLIGVNFVFPGAGVADQVAAVIGQVDFSQALLQGMLAYLLFAGGLHVDLNHLKRRALVVSTMATVGVVILTAIVGVGLWLIAAALGVSLSLPWALVFGALISPTDPIAVQSTLKSVGAHPMLDIDMTGESLLNDGVGVVVFTALLAIALEPAGELTLAEVVGEFVVEAFGGGLLGFLTGYLAYRAMRRIDDYAIEVLISLALATGTYALANALGMSGPIAVVVAGLLIGNRAAEDAMSEETQRYMFGFWTLLDEILNSVLFLLIGLEVLVLRFDLSLTGIVVLAVPLVLAARFVSVLLPVAVLRVTQTFVTGTVAVLTWGGVRGGISIALALSLPEGPAKGIILACTYAVVIFAVIVQGLTLGGVIRRVGAGMPAT